MLNLDRRSMQNFDWVLLIFLLLLVAAGFANLISATASGTEIGISDIARRQLKMISVAGIVLVAAVFIDYRHFERLAPGIFMLSLASLALTLVIGKVTRGAQAWLLPGGSVQPSEFAKVALVMMLARHFHRNPPMSVRHLRQLGPPLLITALPVGLIFLQRDLGVGLLTLLVSLTYLPLLHIPLRAWIGVGVAAGAGLAAVFSFGLEAYHRQRILNFLDPSRDPLSSGYQALQSKIAIGSGGILGTGWQEGTQTQLRFLPTQHTDFVFSVLAEEWGFVGSVVILLLFAAVLIWGLWIAHSSKDGFAAMLAVGLVGTLFWPAAINVAMVLGLAPVIGVPLPFFSQGGSALLSAALASGLLLNISMRRYLF